MHPAPNPIIARKAAVGIGSLGALAGKTISAVAAGGSHSLALCSDGTLAAWGSNSKSQLGVGDISQSLLPVAVERAGSLSGKTILRVAAGGSHSMALCSDGTLAAWGGNSSGQLGNHTTENSSIPSLVDASATPAGARWMWATSGSASHHSLAVVGVLPTESSRTVGNKSVLPADGLVVDSSPLGGDDHDGIPNLMERAFGLDLTKDSSGKLPSLQKAGDHQVIEFDEPIDGDGTTYGVEISSTLRAGSGTEVADQGQGRHHLFIIPEAAGQTMFFRLKVSK